MTRTPEAVLTSVQTGRFTAGVLDVVIRPTALRAHAPVCVYLNSNTGSCLEAVGQFYATMTVHLQRIADTFGVAIVAPTCPTGTFGNGTLADAGTAATCQGRMNDAIGYHKQVLQGDPGRQMLLVGLSAGAIGGHRRCGLDPGNVAALVTYMNVGDLNAVVALDLGGQRSAVNPAYGRSVGDTSAFSAGICPTHGFSDTVPRLMTRGETDGYNVGAGHLTETEWSAGGVAAGRSASFIIVPGVAHGVDAAVSGVNIDDVLSFLARFA